jgi:hypothetical protein
LNVLGFLKRYNNVIETFEISLKKEMTKIDIQSFTLSKGIG